MTTARFDMRRFAAWATALIVALTILAPLAGPASAVGTFDDDDGNIHESAIEKIAALGITKGCNPPTNNRYCPDDYVTREQMASFLVRTLELQPATAGQFTDTSASVHRSDIDALAASGITKGCNPPANTEYCPTDLVTRGQMAAFMARGLDLANEDADYFTDDNNSIFEAQIDAIARIGITKGCNPPDNTEYCPDRPVRRDEMASFLSRVSDIHQTGTTVVNPPTSTPTSTPPTSTPPTTLVPGGPCYTTVPGDAIIVGNPYDNQFTGNAGGLCDKGTVGTGFTWLDQPSNGSGYLRSLLHVNGGHLEMTTTSGLFETSSDSQDNALAIPLNPQITYTVDTKIDSPPAGTGGFEQGGLWWGNDEDNYVKVVYLVNAQGPAVQTRAEVGGAGFGPTRTTQLGSLPASIELRLTADLANLSVQGQYRVPGGAWTNIGAAIPNIPVALWTIDQAGTTTNTFTGLITSHRNGPSPVTFRFDYFKAEGVLSTIACTTMNGMACKKTPIGYKPTSFEWHNNRLYVLSVTGTIHRYSVSTSGALSPDGSWTRLPAPEAGTTYTALGMAVEPGSGSNPNIWIATSRSGGGNYLEGVANSSTVWRIPAIASGSGTTAVPQITGLPRAFENHAINEIKFRDGDLYVAQGGNTGAGTGNNEPGSAFGSRPEQPLSAALLRFDNILSGWNPATDGACASSVTDGPPPTVSRTIPGTCDVDIVSTGLRNTYDFVFHSDGNIYAADNGLGVNGTTPDDPTPPCGDYVQWNDGEWDPGSQPDRLNILDQGGNYYGHPNPTRNECVFFNGNFQGVSPDPDFVGHHQILNTAEGPSPRSLNSVIEYDSGAATSTAGWDGDLLFTAFAGSTQGVFKYDPATGCTNQNTSAFTQGCFSRVGPALGSPLGIEQLPNGRLAVGEWVQRTSNASQFIVIFTPTS